jgi:hypothetical protein
MRVPNPVSVPLIEVAFVPLSVYDELPAVFAAPGNPIKKAGRERRFLAALAVHEAPNRRRPPHRTATRRGASASRPYLGTFDFEPVPIVSMGLVSVDAWLGRGADILLFGPPNGANGQPTSGRYGREGWLLTRHRSRYPLLWTEVWRITGGEHEQLNED